MRESFKFSHMPLPYDKYTYYVQTLVPMIHNTTLTVIRFNIRVFIINYPFINSYATLKPSSVPIQ